MPIGLPSTPSVRDLFRIISELLSGRRCTAYGELVAQRRGTRSFLPAGRDHRNNGVPPTQYDTLRRALYTTLRSSGPSAGADGTPSTAAGQSLNLIIG